MIWDTIVVGAGIEGSAAAYNLAKRGRKTLLLEQVTVALLLTDYKLIIYLQKQVNVGYSASPLTQPCFGIQACSVGY